MLATTCSGVIRSATIHGKPEDRTAAPRAQKKTAVTRNSTVWMPTTTGTTLAQAQASTRFFEKPRRSRPILFFVLCSRASLCPETILQARRSDTLLKVT